MEARDFAVVGFAQNANPAPAPTPTPAANQSGAQMPTPVSVSRSQVKIILGLSVTEKKEEDDGTWKATFTAVASTMEDGVKVPVPPMDIVFKVGNNEVLKVRETTDSEGSAEVEIKGIPAGKHNITAQVEGTLSKKVLKNQAFGEDDKGGKDVFDIEPKSIKVNETSTEITYNLLLTPVNNKGKGVKCTLGIIGWNWAPANADDKKFDGKKAVRVDSVVVTEDTVLDVFVEGSAVSKKVFLNGPYKPSGNKTAIAASASWVLAFVLLMSAAFVSIGSVVGIEKPTDRRSARRRSAPQTEASKEAPPTSTTWIWWTASGLMFATAITLTGVAGVKKGKRVVWAVRKLAADRKMESKPTTSAKPGEASTTKASSGFGWKDYLTIEGLMELAKLVLRR